MTNVYAIKMNAPPNTPESPRIQRSSLKTHQKNNAPDTTQKNNTPPYIRSPPDTASWQVNGNAPETLNRLCLIMGWLVQDDVFEEEYTRVVESDR